MHILIISRGYPTKKYKMNGIFEYDQAISLAKLGHKVTYLSLDMRSFRHKRKFGRESLIKDGVQIEAINIPCGRIPISFVNTLRIISLKVMFKYIVEKYGEPDIIHSHFLHMGYIVARSLHKESIPLVLTEHFSGVNQDSLKSSLLKLGNYTYHRMDSLITVSNYLKRNINKNFNINSTVIPNIVDVEKFSYVKNECRIKNFQFISVGNLTDNKRMSLLINAFAQAFKNNQEVTLSIYGDGPNYKFLKKLISDLNISKTVFLMGQASRVKISRKMSECHCFVLVSERETFGVAYIEAMAAGLPVIGTRSGGPEDFVTKNNGILIENNLQIHDNLVKSLKIMYSKYHYYDRAHISKNISENYSSKSIGERLIKEYEKIIDSKGYKDNA